MNHKLTQEKKYFLMKIGGGHFAPKLGGHFELESGGHFKLELGGQYHWNLQFDAISNV